MAVFQDRETPRAAARGPAAGGGRRTTRAPLGDLQSSAGNRAVSRALRGGGLDATAQRLDKAKKQADVVEFHVSNAESPAAAAGKFAADGDAHASHQADAAYTQLDAAKGLTDTVATAASGVAAAKAFRDVRDADPDTVKGRAARRSLRSKSADAVQNLGSTVSYVLTLAKDALKTAGRPAADAAVQGAGEAGGALLVPVYLAKTVRDLRGLVRSRRTRREVAAVEVPTREAMVREVLALQRRAGEAERARAAKKAELAARTPAPAPDTAPGTGAGAGTGAAFGTGVVFGNGAAFGTEPDDAAAVPAAAESSRSGELRGEIAALDAEIDALREELKQAADHPAQADALAGIQQFAEKKYRRRGPKRGISAAGNALKIGGAVAAVTVAAGLALTPAGLALTAAAALLLGGLAAYKAVKAVAKRYARARQQHTGTEPDGSGGRLLTPGEAFAEALKVWKPVGTSEREAKADELRRLASGSAVHADVAAAARQILVHLSVDAGSMPGGWRGLADEGEKKRWNKLIADKLAS